MKTINEIINDLIEFAEVNGVLGDGGIDIKIGDFEVHKTIPVNLDVEEVPTVEKIMNNSSDKEKQDAREAARKRFMGCGLVDNDGKSFDDFFTDYNDKMVADAIADAEHVEV